MAPLSSFRLRVPHNSPPPTTTIYEPTPGLIVVHSNLRQKASATVVVLCLLAVSLYAIWGLNTWRMLWVTVWGLSLAYMNATTRHSSTAKPWAPLGGETAGAVGQIDGR